MKKVFAAVLAVAICAAASTMIHQHPKAQSESAAATDGAFRDGLFLGHLDAAKGRTRHVCVGRWSSTSDRGQFAAGYEAGYAGE